MITHQLKLKYTKYEIICWKRVDVFSIFVGSFFLLFFFFFFGGGGEGTLYQARAQFSPHLIFSRGTIQGHPSQSSPEVKSR